MGAYVDPPGGDKRQWLNDNCYGEPSTQAPKAYDEFLGVDLLPVCLIDNMAFLAAGVAYSPRELEAFSQPDDCRPKIWYWVDKTKLRDVVSPSYASLL